MTVRELVNYLTQSFVDWEDLEVHVCIADELVKDRRGLQWKDYKVDRESLYTPHWYNGDRCQLVFKRVSQKEKCE